MWLRSLAVGPQGLGAGRRSRCALAPRWLPCSSPWALRSRAYHFALAPASPLRSSLVLLGLDMEPLSRRQEFRIRPELAAIRTFLAALGDPQERFPCLHIAGTNGKGSVAVSLARVLEAAGYRVGLYTSPHLWDFRERVQMNGVPIAADALSALTEQLDHLDRRLGTALTYFEFTTALAFQYFSACEVDWAVLETGMGGRWDATNVVSHPALSIITSVGDDHTQWLGETLNAIAREKAGIIKPETLVISGVQGEPASVIQQTAQAQRVVLRQLGSDFQAEGRQVNWETAAQEVVYQGQASQETYRINLLGPHQVANTALVLAACEGLTLQGFRFSPLVIQRGLSRVHWPGRFEVCSTQWKNRPQMVIVDGAHNPHALRALLTTIETSPWRDTPNHWVIGMLSDKPCRAMVEVLARHGEAVIAVAPQVPRALASDRLAALWRQVVPTARVTPALSVQEGMEIALAQMTGGDHQHGGAVIVTGSLYVVAEALAALDSLKKKGVVHSLPAQPPRPRGSTTSVLPLCQ